MTSLKFSPPSNFTKLKMLARDSSPLTNKMAALLHSTTPPMSSSSPLSSKSNQFQSKILQYKGLGLIKRR